MFTLTLPGRAQPYTVGKIVCLGRNYHDHIRELSNAIPERPVFFIKPATSIIGPGAAVVIPPYSSDCHFEIELALLIGTQGKNIPQPDALPYIAGYGVAIDMTLRDVQNELKSKGLPWEIAKGFDTSCPLSPFVPAASVPHPQDLRMTLHVNGVLRQDSSTALMIRPLAQIVAEASSFFTLEPGDILLTGTPAGVGAVRSGDQMEAAIAGVGRMTIQVR